MTTKNILKALAATAMTAALLGCNKNEPENPDGPASKPLPDEISLSFASPVGVETVGVFITGAKATENVPAKLSAETSRYETKVNTFAEGDKLFAYAPYSTEVTSLDNIAFTIPSEQSVPKSGERNPELTIAVAGPETLPAPDESVSLENPVIFRDITPCVEFSVSDASGAHASETVQSISFISNGTALAGKLVYDITGETPVVKNADLGEKSVTVIPEIVSELGTGKTVYIALLAPGSYTGKAIVETSAARYTFEEISVEAKVGGTSAVTELDLAKASLKEITTEMGWKAFANAVDKGDYSAWKNTDGEVKLGADIEVTTSLQRVGATKEPHDWDGIFNGQGHKIIQHETTVPLFTVIAKDGVVENLVLEGELKKASYPSGPSTAAVAQYNRGTIRNIINGIEINLTDINKDYMIGGMVIMNGGLIEDCQQKGNINVAYNVTKTQIVTYIGGLSCFAADAAEYAKDMSKISVGTFRNCTNTGNITVNKAGVANAYLNKFAIGGICAIVQNGTASAYPLFEGCRNEGAIVRKDDSNGFNSCSAIGGIVGRAANYYQLKAGGAFDVDGYNVYLQIRDCHNTGDIECSAFLTQGWDKGQATSCARMGVTGGIIGYVNGFADSPALISGCTSKSTLRGGHINQSVILGGIAGMTSHATIENCSAETKFEDSSLELDALKLAAVGGVIGHLRHNSSITGGQYSVEIALPKTEIPYLGVAAGGCYSNGAASQALRITGTKFCGSIAYKGFEPAMAITAENLNDYLISFGNCDTEGVSLWTK